MREGDHLEDPGEDGRIILQLFFESLSGGGGGWDINWINLAQDRNRWRAVVYTVLNLRVS
jgi:hypothetical protein